MNDNLRHLNIPDKIWKRLQPLLPKEKRKKGPGGRPRVDDRTAMSAIFYRLKTGIAWRDMPHIFGTKSTLHKRFQEWVKAGVFDRINEEALKLYEHKIKIRNKRMAADGSFARSPKGGFSPDQIQQIAVKKGLSVIF